MRVIRLVDGDETLIVRNVRVIVTDESRRYPKQFAPQRALRWPTYVAAVVILIAFILAAFTEPIDVARKSRMSENAQQLLRLLGN
jgi:hypothetical protein